jgi:hypothetical protein
VGHGTNDRGFSCLKGYHEIVLLRRLPEIHKLNACKMLSMVSGKLIGKKAKKFLYPSLQGGAKIETSWITTDTVEKWNAMKYVMSLLRVDYILSG